MMGVQMDPEVAAALQAADETGDDEVEIWPDMEGAVLLFFNMGTQWNYATAGMGAPIRTGLKYEAMPVVMDMLGVEKTPDLMTDIRIMENEALDVMMRRAA